jgi:hypothetical protein
LTAQKKQLKQEFQFASLGFAACSQLVLSGPERRKLPQMRVKTNNFDIFHKKVFKTVFYIK